MIFAAALPPKNVWKWLYFPVQQHIPPPPPPGNAFILTVVGTPDIKINFVNSFIISTTLSYQQTVYISPGGKVINPAGRCEVQLAAPSGTGKSKSHHELIYR